ncbi:hypothetical protein [Acidisphaera sp. L21]|uniref:hypothetical protein n=1 Tax=Acidisphaera sp. L21 TaxID=1641851 RepID=UPI00131A846B|nr:hypothetical protein [Acidisphaera sp. L21]
MVKPIPVRSYSIEITVTDANGVGQGYGATINLLHETPAQVLAMLEEAIEGATVLPGRGDRQLP